MSHILEDLGLTIPVIQAPMAGVSTPAMAAAVSNAGGLGSIAVGAGDALAAQQTITALRAATARPFNVNLFVHATPVPDPVREAAWCNALAPHFALFDAAPPEKLKVIYTSFADDPDMLAMLVAMRVPVISFHFGLPSPDAIAALKASGARLLATATSRDEARAIAAAGVDAIVAQGIEAGGHRGIFDPKAPDDQLTTAALTGQLVRDGLCPVIAAGGIMDGAGIAAALDLGAVGAQLGTAFIACDESLADAAYRAALTGEAGRQTRLTRVISGRPARVVANHFAALADSLSALDIPDYPIAYDAGKALNAAARAKGDNGYGAQWAGRGAPHARAMSTAALMAVLRDELAAARG